MKLRDYILGIPIFIILMYIIITKVLFGSSLPEFQKAEKTWLTFSSYNRTDIGNLSLMNQRGYGVYPAEPIVHSWEIKNNSNQEFHGIVNLILEKQDNSIKMYYTFNNLRNEIKIPPGATVRVTLLGYLNPEILLTDKLKNYYNRSLSISLVVHDINEYDTFYWDSRSYYFAHEHYNTETDDYKLASIQFINETCSQLKEKYAVRWNIQPKICYNRNQDSNVSNVDVKAGSSPAGSSPVPMSIPY